MMVTSDRDELNNQFICAITQLNTIYIENRMRISVKESEQDGSIIL